jgi:hypothetical protein
MMSRGIVNGSICSLKNGASLCAALLVTLFTASAVAQYRLPGHRGPLTSREMKAVVKGVRLRGPGRNLKAAARRYLHAKQTGRRYRPRRYQVIENDQLYGGTIIAPKGVPRDRVYNGNYALISEASIHVQLDLKRGESGKRGPTELGIRLNPGQGLNRRRGPHSMYITETRTSSNGNTPGSRLTHRSYEGARWEHTFTHESDGNMNRGGKRLKPGKVAETMYQPGNRMSISNGTFKTAKNHRPVR